jgi:hypothetical protein
LKNEKTLLKTKSIMNPTQNSEISEMQDRPNNLRRASTLIKTTNTVLEEITEQLQHAVKERGMKLSIDTFISVNEEQADKL